MGDGSNGVCEELGNRDIDERWVVASGYGSKGAVGRSLVDGNICSR